MEAGTGIRAGVFWVNFKSIFKQNSRPRFTPNCVIAICKLDAIKKYISNHHLYKAGKQLQGGKKTDGRVLKLLAKTNALEKLNFPSLLLFVFRLKFP